jgi:F420-dependent oxidoreductase-like protein
VIEGFHGVKYDAQLGRTREVIEICRQVWQREPVEFRGNHYTIPLTKEDGGSGLGKPLKLINHPVREDIPIYLASLGPKNLQLTAEVADGWLPAFFHPDKAQDVFGADLALGAKERDPSRGPLEIVAGGTLSICDKDTAQKLRDAGRGGTALYVGGMGARGRNFYNNVFRKYGYEKEAEEIQNLYLDGKKQEAEALVPDDYLEATALVGDEGFVRDRVLAYKEAGVTRLSVRPVGENPLELIEKVKAWTE